MYINTEDTFVNRWSSCNTTANNSNSNSSNEDSGNESKSYDSRHHHNNNSSNSCSSNNDSSSDDNDNSDGNEADRDEKDSLTSDANNNINNNCNNNNNGSTSIPRRRRRVRRTKTVSSSSSQNSQSSSSSSLPSDLQSNPQQSPNINSPNVMFRPTKPDIEIELNLTLDNIYNGCIKRITYEKYAACSNCKGLGCLRTVPCIDCKGCGQIFSKRCTLCKGTGKLSLTQEKCPACCGCCFEKQIVNDFSIEIPAGINSENALHFQNEGNYIPGTQEHGSLIVRFKEIPHRIYKRDGFNLSTEVRLSLRDALCGYSLNISHLNGKQFLVKSPKGKITRPNDCVVVKGLGLPIPLNSQNGSGNNDQNSNDDNNGFGDLVIKLLVDFPPDNFFTQESIDILSQVLCLNK